MKELIFKNNPWWKDKKDPDIKKWESMKIRWIPRWIEKLSLKFFSLNFVIGFRQLGKTTGIKILIQKILKKERPESIFYFNCDFLPTAEKLREVLDLYLELKKSEGIDKSFIFLDEITSVPEWWRVIKGYIDLGIFENDVLTVTGSSSIKLKGEAELFPGRRGKGKDVIVMPLSFREFLEVHGVKVKPAKNLKMSVKGLMKNEEEIKGLFKSYVKLGGFPLSINKDPTAEQQFIAAFETEILKAKRSLQLTKEILASLIRKAPSPLSFSTIGNDVGVSYKTVQEYIETLRKIFILDIAYFKRKRIIWRKERKFFFLGPFIANTLSLWTGEQFLESAFYEWIVQSHLLRRFSEVFYFRNKFEIDCIANNLKIEVKAGKPHRAYPKDVVVLDKDNLHLFLAVV